MEKITKKTSNDKIHNLYLHLDEFPVNQMFKRKKMKQ